MAAKIKGDRVIVTTGRDKGKRGEVRQVMPEDGRALSRASISCVAIRARRRKPRSRIISKESTIHLSIWRFSIPRRASRRVSA